MQKIILALLLATSICFGYFPSPKVPEDVTVLDASVNNIPTAYDTTAGSQLASNLANRTMFSIYNNTAVDIAVRVKGVTCDSATGDQYTIPAGLAFSPPTPIAINKVLCIRSLGAAINTGTVHWSVN